MKVIYDNDVLEKLHKIMLEADCSNTKISSIELTPEECTSFKREMKRICLYPTFTSPWADDRIAMYRGVRITCKEECGND